MSVRRFFTAAGITAVTVVAGAISYRHQQHLAFAHGQPHALSVIWPLCVDGLVASTGIAVATDRAAGFRPRLWALFGFWLGVVVSVATNWLATDGGIIAHGVSAFPALAFLLSVESLSAKPRAAKRATARVPVTSVAPVEPVASAVTVTPSAAPPARVVDATPPAADRPAVASRVKPSAPRRTQSAAAKVASVARRMPDASPAVIAAKAGVSESTARRHLAATVTPPKAALGQVNGAQLATVTA